MSFQKTRLHFINQDSILIFDMMNLTKRRNMISFDKKLWPLAKQDTVERGRNDSEIDELT